MTIKKEIGIISIIFFNLIIQLKIFHYQTLLYSHHKVIDDLINSLSDKLDLFLEIMQGLYDCRLRLPSNGININVQNCNEKYVKEVLNEFKIYLTKTIHKYIKNNSQLSNIRDEILGSIDQTIYLLSFK